VLLRRQNREPQQTNPTKQHPKLDLATSDRTDEKATNTNQNNKPTRSDKNSDGGSEVQDPNRTAKGQERNVGGKKTEHRREEEAAVVRRNRSRRTTGEWGYILAASLEKGGVAMVLFCN